MEHNMRLRRKHLSEIEEEDIRNLSAYGMSAKEIMVKFGLKSLESVYRILRSEPDEPNISSGE